MGRRTGFGEASALRYKPKNQDQIGQKACYFINSMRDAAREGRFDDLSRLVGKTKGADIDLPDQNGATALMYAAGTHTGTDCLEKMIQVTRKLNKWDVRRWNALHFAAQGNSPGACTMLLAAGLDPEWEGEGGVRPIHVAAENDSDNAILELGVDPNIRTKSGWTPIHLACKHGGANAVAALLKIGADLHASLANGQRPLHIVAEQGSPEIMHHLLDYGAGSDETVADVDGNLPLHLATMNGSAAKVKMLLTRAGGLSHIHTSNGDGDTVTELASIHKSDDVMQILIDVANPRPAEWWLQTDDELRNKPKPIRL